MRVPSHCPSCGGALRVSVLTCQTCATRIEGSYPSCPLCRLGPDDQALLERFLRCRGNVKQMERELGLSYPTVRLRLEELWGRMGMAAPEPVSAPPVRRTRSPRPSQEAPAPTSSAPPAPSGAGGSRTPRVAPPAAQILLDLREGKITPAEAAERLRRSGRATPPSKGDDDHGPEPDSRDPAGGGA